MTRRGVRPMPGTPPAPLMNQLYSPHKHDNSNRPSGFGQNSHQFRPQYQPSQGSSYMLASQASNQQDQSDSFGDFTDMPTDFFNTANFGTVAIPPLGTGNTNTTGDMGTGTGPSNLTRSMVSDPRFTVPGDDADMDRLGDLDLPPDFDDDVDIKDAPITQHHPEGNMDFTTQDVPRERSSTQRPLHVKNSGPVVSNAAMQAAEEELRQLKMQLAERDELIKAKEKELMLKTGENSILKENCEKFMKDVRTTAEQARQDKFHDAQERAKMKEEFDKELKNQSMAHQFDIFNMQKTKASVPIKVSETPKQSPTQQPAAVTPEFPSMFSTPNRGSRASSVKPSRAEERLSVSNFARTPKSPQKSRSSRLDAAAFDRGSSTAPVPTIAYPLGSGARTPSVLQSAPLILVPPQTKNIYSINIKVPKSTPEGRIRKRLLGGTQDSIGLRELMGQKGHESGYAPLQGTTQFKKDSQLEKLSQRCANMLTELTIDVNETTIKRALKATTMLLQQSIALRKPMHTRNAVSILRKLYATYDYVAKEVSTGRVSFLDDVKEDPLESILPEGNLSGTPSPPTPLTCIMYLLITRFAQCWPSAAAVISSSASRHSSGGSRIALVNVPPNSGLDNSWISLDAESALPKEDYDLFEEDIFALVEGVVRDQLARHLSEKMMPLAHWRIFDNVLKLHRDNIRTLDRTLTVLDVISRDPKCCRFYCGWSHQRKIWTDTFTQIETLANLLILSSPHDSELANGGIPRLKLKVLDVMDRAVRIDVEQTRKIARESTVVYHVVRALREQVELCERIKTHRSLAKAFGDHEEAFRPPDDFEFKPSIMFDTWNPSTLSMVPPSRQLSSDITSETSSLPQNYNCSYVATLKTSTSDKVRKTLTAPTLEHDHVTLIRALLDFMLHLLRQLAEHATWMKTNKFVDHADLCVSVGSLAVKNFDLSPGAAELAADLLAEIFSEDEQEQALLELLHEPRLDGKDDDNW
ncbi:hypothetical protein BGZ74_006445 [Mortierella antarctica]|nr:hypothetical protein BGZ74_006445 [Mortierella antarctica]